MASPRQIAHFVLSTHQHDAIINWYARLLDAKVRFNNGVLAFISFDDEHHRVAIANLDVLDPDSKRDPAKGTCEHVAFTFNSFGDLLENYARLKAVGLEPYWCIHHGITVSMYYSDPDGNQVEMQVDAFENADDANAFLEGPIFEKNPIGVEYDPDEMLAKYRAGVPDSELMAFDSDAPRAPIRQSPTRGLATIVT